MYISKFRAVSLEKKDTKNNFISEANKMINQNSTATIDNLDEAYIASLMDQLVWAPFQQIQSLNLNATISADFSQKSATY